MKRQSPLWIAAATATLFCMAYGVDRSYAGGIPVIDVTNLTQNILTAVRTLQSNINEAQQIVNQIKSLENEFRNLQSLPFSVVDSYRNQFQGLFDAVGRVHSLMEDYSQLEAKFDQLYPDWSRETSLLASDVVSQKARELLEQSRQSVLGASLTGAKVLQDLPKTQAELESLMTNSQNAVGILQAAQSGNQIAGLIAGNLTNLNAQLAKYTQAHMSYLMRIQQDEAADQNRMDHVLDSVYRNQKVARPAAIRTF